MRKQSIIIRKYCLIIIAVCCLWSLVISNLYIAENGEHFNHKHCGQAECSVCVNISHANGLLNNIRLITGNSAFLSIQIVCLYLGIRIVCKQIFSPITLVKMKTRLDN